METPADDGKSESRRYSVPEYSGPVLFYNETVIDHFTNPRIDAVVDALTDTVRRLRAISSLENATQA